MIPEITTKRNALKSAL